jgi:3-isopropylmalate dehydratase small subunit
MAYDKFNILTSTAVPLSIENVDTDQIIPARFLKQPNVLVLATTFSVIEIQQ